MQQSVVNYSQHAVHQTSRIYSSYNWKVIPFDQQLPISSTPQPLTATILLSVCECSFFRLHVKVRLCSVCLFLSDLFHLASCPQGSSKLLQMARFLYFLRLNNIPFYICAIFALSICLSMATIETETQSVPTSVQGNDRQNMDVGGCRSRRQIRLHPTGRKATILGGAALNMNEIIIDLYITSSELTHLFQTPHHRHEMRMSGKGGF